MSKVKMRPHKRLLASCVAMIVGVALSLHLWKHWPLLILSGISIVVLVVAIMTELGTLFFAFVVPAYGILVVMFSGLWFVVLRRRNFPTAVK